jgi:penicillin amidase
MRARQLRIGRKRPGRRFGRAANIVAALAVSVVVRLGLLRTAQQEWAQMTKDSLAAQALTAYAQGVNAWLAQVRASGQWPAVFLMPGVYPAPWTPVDSLAVQGVLTQELDFTTTPLDYALLERSLGAARTMDWFGVIAKNAQTPYDPGPYARLPLTPLAPGVASTMTNPPAGARGGTGARTAARSAPNAAEAEAAGTLLAQLTTRSRSAAPRPNS